MKPILDELKRDYAAQFETTFIDVWKIATKGNATAFSSFRRRSSSMRRARSCFATKDSWQKDILAKWQELGVAPPTPPRDTGGERDRGSTLYYAHGRDDRSAVPSRSPRIAWGVLSIVLSPCHLASIPLIVWLPARQRPRDFAPRLRAPRRYFAMGILLSIALIGAATAAGCRDVWRHTVRGETRSRARVCRFSGSICSMWSRCRMRGDRNPHNHGAVPAWCASFAGLIFGVALGPCTFGFMAPVLGVTFGAADQFAVLCLRLFALFALGHRAVIALAGTSSTWVQRSASAWQGITRAKMVSPRMRRVVVLAGSWLAYSIQ